MSKSENQPNVLKLPDSGPAVPDRPLVHVKVQGNQLDVQGGENLKQTFGVETTELAIMLLDNLAQTVTKDGASEEKELNQNLAIVHGIAPRDPLEALLAVQMAAIHNATIQHFRHLLGARRLESVALHERILNKLSRTFVAQMEALRKHRNGGEQTVRVEHVTVNEGGQAIVGNVRTGGSGKQKSDPTP